MAWQICLQVVLFACLSLGDILWCSTSKGGTPQKLYVSHFITMIMGHVSHVLLFIFWLWTISWCQLPIDKMPSLSEGFYETIKQQKTWLTLTSIMVIKWDTCSFQKVPPPLWCAASYVQCILHGYLWIYRGDKRMQCTPLTLIYPTHFEDVQRQSGVITFMKVEIIVYQGKSYHFKDGMSELLKTTILYASYVHVYWGWCQNEIHGVGQMRIKGMQCTFPPLQFGTKA